MASKKRKKQSKKAAAEPAAPRGYKESSAVNEAAKAARKAALVR